METKEKTEDISFLLPIREFPDKGTKWLLEFSENVKGLLQIVASDLVEQLDFSRLEKVNQSFIPDNLREQESDVVYLIPFRSEAVGEVMIYVLIEHQSTPSPVMAFRVLFYMVQIWDAQRRAWEDNKVPQTQWRFRPIIPIVLYTGTGTWEVPIRMDVLMDVPRELSRFVPTFDTLFLNVKGEEEPDFLSENHPFGWLLSVIRKEEANKAELEEALRRAVENLSQLPEDELNQWTRAMYYLILLVYHRRSPREHEELIALLGQSITEKRRIEEMQEMRQTIAEHFIEEGELKAKREDVLKIVQLRFHAVPPTLVKRIKSIRRLERLDNLLERVVIANSISEIEMD